MPMTDTQLEPHEEHWPPDLRAHVVSLPRAWCRAILALAVVGVALIALGVWQLDAIRTQLGVYLSIMQKGR